MAERKGFWSLPRREGREDAQVREAERLHELRQLPYAELRSRAGNPTELEDVAGPDGRRLRRRTSVKRISRGGEEELRIVVRVDDGTLLGRLNPLAEDLVVATPDGGMIGDYTMAGEGNDPRRYRFPRRGR